VHAAFGAHQPLTSLAYRLPPFVRAAQLLEAVLVRCSVSQLGMLQSTCTYFRALSMIEVIAKGQLREVPRARSLRPAKREHETYLSLLHFINCQSAAAAQATAVACGGHHTSALLEPTGDACGLDGRHALYTFGRNFHGQLGAGDFEDHSAPTAVSLGFRQSQQSSELEEETMAAVVACGSHHSMCMSRRGELYSWGLCRAGELGQGAWAPLEVPRPRQCQLSYDRIISVSCGASHTLAIGESGCLWACGSNATGQLGAGNLADSPVLQRVQQLPASRIVSAAAGAAHSVALSSDGSLYTWGDGSRGQLGHRQLQGMALPAMHDTIVLLLPQKVARLDPTGLLPEHRVTAMSAGSYHTLVLTVGGGVFAFGANDSGCLGLGDEADRWKPTRVNLPLAGEEGMCIRAVQLSCGAAHSLVLVSKQGSLQVRAAGCNKWGQLGLGDGTPRSRFMPTLSVPRVAAVQAGAEHSAAITEDGHLFMWGRGDSGQLGLGDMLGRRWPTLVHGFSVVHPDRTLRRSKRDLPFMRPTQAAAAGAAACAPACDAPPLS